MKCEKCFWNGWDKVYFVFEQQLFWSYIFNSFSAKIQTTFVICIFILTNYLNVKQGRSRWDGSLSRLIWIYAVCKSLSLSPVAVKELMKKYTDKMKIYHWKCISQYNHTENLWIYPYIISLFYFFHMIVILQGVIIKFISMYKKKKKYFHWDI